MAGWVILGRKVPQHRIRAQTASAQGIGARGRGRGGRQVVQQHPIFPGLSPSSGRALQAQTAGAAISGQAVPERGILFAEPRGRPCCGVAPGGGGVGQHTYQDPSVLGRS